MFSEEESESRAPPVKDHSSHFCIDDMILEVDSDFTSEVSWVIFF